MADMENWQSGLTQAIDEQPCKIKQINVIYGENRSISNEGRVNQGQSNT